MPRISTCIAKIETTFKHTPGCAQLSEDPASLLCWVRMYLLQWSFGINFQPFPEIFN